MTEPEICITNDPRNTHMKFFKFLLTSDGRDRLLELLFALIVCVIGFYFVYQGSKQQTDQTGFYYIVIPELTVDGIVTEKYRVDDELKFVLKVDETYMTASNINLQDYHTVEVGDEYTAITQEYRREARIVPFILGLSTIALAFMAKGAWILISATILFTIGVWAGLVTVSFIPLLIINATIYSLVWFARVQRQLIQIAIDEGNSETFFTYCLFITCDKKLHIKYFGLVRVIHGQLYMTGADATVAKLKGEI